MKRKPMEKKMKRTLKIGLARKKTSEGKLLKKL